MTALVSAIVVLTNAGYTVAFDTETRNPAWVSYDLEPCKVIHAPREPLPFTPDPRIPDTDHSADYFASGYDRGHLAPAADFNWSTNALRETYRYTNVSPQLPELNRCGWLDAEREVRRLAESGTVHVLTFPLGFRTNRVGRVCVPASFVKVAYGAFGIRFWKMENEKPTKTERNNQ